MENKEQLIVAIRRWLSLDNEIAQLNQTLKEKRNEKKELTESLTNVMNTHDIDCFNSRQAKLIKARRKVKSSITKKYLVQTLSDFFGETENSRAGELLEYIMDNRSEQIKEIIRRKDIKGEPEI